MGESVAILAQACCSSSVPCFATVACIMAWQVCDGGLHADAGGVNGRALDERFVLVADTFLEVFVFPTFISCGQGSIASWCAPFGTS